MALCPCGSGKGYVTCCGLYLENNQQAITPEQLMRSRYTAYTLANIPYIKNSMHGKPLNGFNEEQALQWAKDVTWLELRVLQSYQESPDRGFVEFIAYFIEHNQKKSMHELSEFHRINNKWLYVDGTSKGAINQISKHKIAKNSPCPCNSGRKFKNCHEK